MMMVNFDSHFLVYIFSLMFKKNLSKLIENRQQEKIFVHKITEYKLIQWFQVLMRKQIIKETKLLCYKNTIKKLNKVVEV